MADPTRQRILIAEDSPTQALKLQIVLEGRGYDVEVARDGERALEALAKDSYDLLLSDIVMPGISGFDLCRKIKQNPELLNTPVILLTTLKDPMDIIEGLVCGADNFITKPYEIDFLFQRIDTIFLNRTMQRDRRLNLGLEMIFMGKRLTINSDTEQILGLLFSTFEEFVRAKQAADEANQAKSDFLARMSHELRTPLNSIIGFANLMGKNKAGELSEQNLNYVQRVNDNGRHLLGLINGILDLSKIEAGRMEVKRLPVQLADLVRETVELMGGAAREADVVLELDLPNDLAEIDCDPEKLKQVLINLVANALKFTDQGSVTVRVEAEGRERRPLNIAVIDTGSGIPEDKQSQIFDAFEQIDAGDGQGQIGTGLGLSICRSLCQLMGYRIRVASEEGRGSTFTIDL